MKQLIFLILTLIALPLYAGDYFEWLGGTVFNMGTVREADGPVSHRFIMRNISPDTITILRAASTCGCTTATVSHRKVAPGDTASVIVTYNPYRQTNYFHQKVGVMTDCPQRINYLFVKGSVESSHQSASNPK